MSSPFDCIFFDLDETLFDRTAAQVGAARLIAERHPDHFARLDPDEVTRAFLESDRISTEQFDFSKSPREFRLGRSRIFLDLLGVSHNIVAAVTDAYVNLYPRIAAPVPSAVETLDALKGHCKLGLISNGLPDVQYAKLDALDIRDYFDAIALSREVGVEKPDPAIFLAACRGVGADPAGCLHVGDDPVADVAGAKQVGMKACWYNPREIEGVEGRTVPDYEIRDLGELLRL